jgi:endonuclease/exonuclease/phosphatase family metal-dependent hydrolase
VLSQTLQATRNPRHVLDELLRIADRAIVSFPNFGHWRVRWSLLSRGRMPETEALPMPWWSTPNIHLCTLADFLALTADLNLRVDACAAFAGTGPARAIEPDRRARELALGDLPVHAQPQRRNSHQGTYPRLGRSLRRMKKLRLMTYNVHRCVGTDRALDVERWRRSSRLKTRRRGACRNWTSPRSHQGRRPGPPSRRTSEDELSHFHPAMTVEKELYGDAILTALPERRIKAKGLPLYRRVPGLEPRGALWVEVDVGGTAGPDHQHPPGPRAAGAEAPGRRPAGRDWMGADGWVAPGVVLGDFNATPYSATYRMLRTACATPRRPAPAGNAGDRRPFPPASRSCASTTSS